MKNTFTRNLFALAACATLSAGNGFAQHQDNDYKHCGSDIMLNQLYQQYPGLQQEAELKHRNSWEEGKRNIENNRSATPPTYVIPVVFHIIHDYGTENISDAQILDQMDILNEDFRKTNADTTNIIPEFQGIADDCEIEFRLAQIDPWGNCTNGIDRIPSMETYVGDDGSKLNQWPRDKYLNIWVVRQIGAAGVAGYAYYPGAVDGFLYPYDGIIILSTYVGSIGTGSPFTSRALTHEVGHSLSLSHVWGNNNQPGVACGDDGILDTPVTKGWDHCPTPATAKVCDTSVVENYQNFMEYSYCENMYTEDQGAAMRYTLNSSTADRNNLWTTANLTATGCLNVQPTCKPHADFSANRRMVCEGGSITLSDESWSSNATSWSWTLTGPTTLTSSAQNPTFNNLNTTGWYNVQLIATNSAGSDTMVQNNYLLVSTDAANFNWDYFESFEQPYTFAGLGYVANNRYHNNSWFFQCDFAGHTGTHSACLNNYNNTIEGDKDELITPSYFLDWSTGLQLQFSYAYATAALAADMNTCTLKVYSSTDCGQTWNQRWIRSGQNLATAGYFSTFFVPTNANHWETVTINLPTSLNAANVRFKFEFTSPEDGTGNNLYIDDINILSTNVSVEENDGQAPFNLYPNPTSGNSTINYSLTEQTAVKADLYDVSGRLVRNIYTGEQQAGEYNLAVSDETNPLAPGTYLIQMTIGDKVSTRQLIVTGQE